MYPFKAVYAYTPSKLPPSVASLKLRPTEQMSDTPETVAMPIPSFSLTASDERTSRSGSVDDVESATTRTARQASSVSSIEGLDKIEVYDCPAAGVSVSASLCEGGPAVGQECITSSQQQSSDVYINGNEI